jgi:hypothetical protein
MTQKTMGNSTSVTIAIDQPPVVTSDTSFGLMSPVQAFTDVTNVANTLSTLGISIPSWATLIIIFATGGTIFYRTDNINPTVANGIPVYKGQSWPIVTNTAINNLKLIASTTTSIAIEFRG